MSFEAATDTPTSPPAAGSRLIGMGPAPARAPDTFEMSDFLTKGSGGFFPPAAFGGTDWTDGYAPLSGKTSIALGRAVSAYSNYNGYSTAFLGRVDYASARFADFFFGPTTIVGSITTNGSSVSYNTTSDYRLKEDDVPLADAPARIMALRPVNFRWRVSGEREDGFFAHEVADIVPCAVRGARDAMREEVSIDPETGKRSVRTVPDYQQLDPAKLVPLLVAGLQAALAELAALKAAVQAMAPPASGA